MARPEKPIDWEIVDQFLEAGCNGTQIAAHFNMNPETFYRKVESTYKVGFTEYSSQKNQYGEALIKLAQFNKAIGKSKKGDTTLLTYLGRVRLKQIEPHHEMNNEKPPLEEHLLLQDEVLQLKNKLRTYENASQPETGTELHRSNSSI